MKLYKNIKCVYKQIFIFAFDEVNSNLIFLYMDGKDAVRYILKNNIDGVLVECGVEKGKQQLQWIDILMTNNQFRDIYLYDTFAGLTKPGEYDYTRETSQLFQMNKDDVYNTWKQHKIDENTNNWCYGALDTVRSLLNGTGYPREKIHYIVGDVIETLQNKNNIPDKIAILRLDTDWYESSKVELEKLYDNVVKGGIIIFDDYYLWDGQRRATDDFFESRKLNYDIVDLGNKQSAAIIKK